MKNISIILALVTLCLGLGACSVADTNQISQGYRNYGSSSSYGNRNIVAALFPRTAQALNRINNPNRAIRNTYPSSSQAPAYISAQDMRDYKEFLAWKYGRNNYASRSSNQSNNDYAEFLRSQAAYRNSQNSNSGQSPTNYSNTRRANSPYMTPDQQAELAEVQAYFDRTLPGKPINMDLFPSEAQVQADTEAAQVSLDKLPWESEPEYRARLQKAQAAATARANRYNALASQAQYSNR